MNDLIAAGLVFGGASVAAMLFPPVRRVFGALCRFTLAHIPRWLALILAPVLFVAALIPGQLDELALLALVLGPVLARAVNRAELAASVREAWKG